jgi:hypothetical protein
MCGSQVWPKYHSLFLVILFDKFIKDWRAVCDVNCFVHCQTVINKHGSLIFYSVMASYNEKLPRKLALIENFNTVWSWIVNIFVV